MAGAEQTIVLVDDERSVLNALRCELAEWADERGIEIVAETSAQDALEFLSERGERTVMVVSDLHMPGMNGSELLAEVRSRYPAIVTVMVTGFSETEELMEAVRLGVFSYILKPWNRDYLLAELQKAYDHGELKRQNARYLRAMEEELRWAGEMQKALLKPSLPKSGEVEFFSTYRPVPALHCGGDYYDVIVFSRDRYLILAGDVAGHGVRAAFVTGILKAVIFSEYVRAALGRDFSPSAFLRWLNDRMNFELRSASGLIITFCAGVLDLGAMRFRYANAGQNRPVLVRNGTARELLASGPGIGFLDSVTYEEEAVELKIGDAFTLYTDGLVESGATAGRSQVPPRELFERVAYGPDYHRRLMAEALETSGSADFDDDVTMVTAYLNGGGHGAS